MQLPLSRARAGSAFRMPSFRTPTFRWPSLEAWLTFIVVAVCVALTFGMLQPRLLLMDSLPAGGDMGAHVWGPWYMKSFLFEHWRVTGWTPDWYAGFPAFTFYFPLPAMMIAILSFVIPYGIAFKLVSVSGVVLMPLAAWLFGKFARLPFPAPACLSAGAFVYVFHTGFAILGGNIMSTLAGEYSFSIGLSFALVFLGLVAGGLDTGKRRGWAAVLFACTILSHVLPTLFAIVVGLILIAMHHRHALKPLLRWAVPVAVAGCFLAAFWAIPFLANHNYMNDMGWEKMGEGTESGTTLFGQKITHYNEALVINDHGMRIALLFALGGGAISIWLRRRMGIALGIAALVMAIGFVYMPQGRLWNARILPFYYLTIYLLAALFVAELGISFASWVRKQKNAIDIGDGIALATPLMALVIALSIVTPKLPAPGWWPSGWADGFWHTAKSGASDIPAWAKWNYSGYDGKDSAGKYFKPAYPEFLSVVNMMRDVGRSEGCGRVMWEFESDLNRFGTTMALQLLPKYTNGCMGSMEGLFFESSPTVPYHFLAASELSKAPSNPMRDIPYRGLDVANGVTKLQLMGVKYYLALSPEAQFQADGEPRLRRVGSVPAADSKEGESREWIAYSVADADIVAPLEYLPNVMTAPKEIKERRNPKKPDSPLSDREAWLENQLKWLDNPENLTTPLAAEGPKEWPRIANADTAVERQKVETSVVVTRIGSDDDNISFHVDQTGVPVVVKASYFPNWKVKGAKGPYRISPNQMAVIPTTNDVTLYYGRNWADWLGFMMTVTGLASLWWLRRRTDVGARNGDANDDGVDTAASEASVESPDNAAATSEVSEAETPTATPTSASSSRRLPT